MPSRGRRGEITIVGEKTALPFSRGILARSLVDVGIPSDEAYAVAQDIQKLLKAGFRYREEELAKIVYGYLRKNYGRNVAARYRALLSPAGVTVVVGRQRSSPFSKMILLRSIKAAGVDAQTALKVAQDVELRLRSAGRQRITSGRLRKMVYEVVRRRVGEQYAKRYLLWRKVLSMKRPFVLLIGGATGVGKSTLAIELANELGIAYVTSTDVIREMMRTLFTEELLPFIHRSSYTAGEVANIPSASNPVLAAFYEQAMAVNVGVKAIIRRASVENVPTIINGVHLVPGFIDREEFDAVIVQILLYVPDEEVHRMRFRMRQSGARKRTSKEYIEHFEHICMVQDYLVESAHKYGVPVIESMNFEETVDVALNYITDILSDTLSLVGEDV